MPSQRYKELLDQAWDLHVRKNAGYAGADNPDPWANFRMCEAFGVSAFTGAMVRLSDKYIRVANLMKNPANDQVGESILETLDDLAAYAHIARILKEEEMAEDAPAWNLVAPQEPSPETLAYWKELLARPSPIIVGRPDATVEALRRVNSTGPDRISVQTAMEMVGVEEPGAGDGPVTEFRCDDPTKQCCACAGATPHNGPCRWCPRHTGSPDVERALAAERDPEDCYRDLGGEG